MNGLDGCVQYVIDYTKLNIFIDRIMVELIETNSRINLIQLILCLIIANVLPFGRHILYNKRFEICMCKSDVQKWFIYCRLSSFVRFFITYN